jgi:Na+-translocating ferredoxin:NAD+ oxidoreductase RnfG subunit
MDKIKGQLAGVAALLGVIAAIGGGFVKYGEVMTKLEILEGASKSIDMSFLSEIKVLEEKVNKLENVDSTHEHVQEEHTHTNSLINKKEIELLKVQLEEVKESASNPLAN